MPVEGMRADGTPESAFAFLAFAWRRKWVVVLTAIIVSALGYLYYLRQEPVFESGLQAIVIKPPEPFGRRIGDAGLAPEQLDMILTSARVVKAAVGEHQLDKLPGLSQTSDPARKIRRGLSVRSRTAEMEGQDIRNRHQGRIMMLNYRSPYRENCPKVLVAVMEQFQIFLGETDQMVSQEMVDLIEQARVQLDEEVAAAREKYLDFRYSAPPAATKQRCAWCSVVSGITSILLWVRSDQALTKRSSIWK